MSNTSKFRRAFIRSAAILAGHLRVGLREGRIVAAVDAGTAGTGNPGIGGGGSPGAAGASGSGGLVIVGTGGLGGTGGTPPPPLTDFPADPIFVDPTIPRERALAVRL